MRDLYREVTDRIIAALEGGTPPWVALVGGHRGLSGQRRHNRPYRGVNAMLLTLEASCAASPAMPGSPSGKPRSSVPMYAAASTARPSCSTSSPSADPRQRQRRERRRVPRAWCRSCVRSRCSTWPRWTDCQGTSSARLPQPLGPARGRRGSCGALRCTSRARGPAGLLPAQPAISSGSRSRASLRTGAATTPPRCTRFAHWTGHQSRCDRHLCRALR